MTDLTVVSIPGYFATMGAEHLWLRRRAERNGPSRVDYEPRDTVTSLSMGIGSLLVPLAMGKLLAPITPGKGRYGKVLVGVAAGAAAVTTAADIVARMDGAGAATTDGDGAATTRQQPEPVATAEASRAGSRRLNRKSRRLAARVARKVASVGGVATVVTGGLAVTTAWANLTAPKRLWSRRVVRDLGTGPLVLAAAVLAWDFIYYWNHRFMHESRYMWAIHEVHHSSERYNLSTALRQPVADAFGTSLPYGAMCLLGIRPELVATARELNLLYQYWIHTDTVRRLGRAEEVLNTPSHHRVHHGANKQYIDRNHGSIFILWDRLFGTFEPEDEPVVYGLTRNIETFNPLRVATHEHAEILGDVARSTSWRERLSYVLRGPGWSYQRRAEREALEAARNQAGAATPDLAAAAP